MLFATRHYGRNPWQSFKNSFRESQPFDLLYHRIGDGIRQISLRGLRQAQEK